LLEGIPRIVVEARDKYLKDLEENNKLKLKRRRIRKKRK
jgi:hypothetical protein